MLDEWEDDQYEAARQREQEERAAADRADDGEARYVVRRFYAAEAHPDHRRVIMAGVTLADAAAHCRRESTHEPGVWFDGYERDYTLDRETP